MSYESQELVDRATKIATSTFANALDDFGLADRILPTIKAVANGMRATGPAVTVRESVSESGAYQSEDFKVGAIIDAANSGDFLVIAGGGARISSWGGMASFAAQKKGVAGLIADIGVRDLEEIIKFNFPVFARYLTPLTGRTRLKVEEINKPVEVDSVIIEPGDLVVADGTGVVVLPSEHAEKIVINAELYNADDRSAIKDLDNGLTFTEVMNKYSRI